MMLSDLATVIRSKNAGPFELTFDVLFATQDDFMRVVRSEILSAKAFAELFRIPISDVISVVEFEPALAVKITIKRSRSSGAFGETDVYGAQQHAPLLQVEVP
ncbi:DUF4387 domain-containing protein [Litoricolaceae bacterium]|nr:DUF4387 domain-containing protein [Litorivicinaceae bacterium]NCW74744.1 DUF4387 domain-containing protein [Gammaproteobacteria bacterium]